MAKKQKQSIEKDIADLHKHIKDQNFESIEELQKFMDQTVGKTVDEIVPQKKGRRSKKEMAQDLVYEAHEASPAKAKGLIKRALKLDPDNADAYNFMAGTTQDPNEALYYFKRGMEAGRKTIGEKDFKELKGHFWGFHETRPYMRAKAGYAECLSITGQYDESINQYQQLLVLNPNDNQGVRFQLAPLLVDQNKFAEYQKLYKKFEEDVSAQWIFTYALFVFKKEGRSLKSTRALKKAHEANPFVLPFFVAEKKFPDHLPEYMSFGDENEAILCTYETGEFWIDTKGAMEWAFEFYEKQKNLN
jgi:tetratricopeptide (TPR) repeat protein